MAVIYVSGLLLSRKPILFGSIEANIYIIDSTFAMEEIGNRPDVYTIGSHREKTEKERKETKIKPCYGLKLIQERRENLSMRLGILADDGRGPPVAQMDEIETSLLYIPHTCHPSPITQSAKSARSRPSTVYIAYITCSAISALVGLQHSSSNFWID